MLLAVVIFLSVFVITSLVLMASGSGASEQAKLAMARLDSVLATQGKKVKDELVNIRKEELLSSIPALNRLLLRWEIAPKLRGLLYQSTVALTPGGLVLMSAAAFILPAYLVYLRTGSIYPAVIVGIVAGLGPLGYVYNKRARRFARFERDLPSAIDLMVNGLRGGHSLVSTLGLVAREIPDPIGREFRACFDEQNYGLDLRTAMDNLSERVPIQDVRIVITAILIQRETGGNLAEVLDKCSHVIRERFRLKREIRVRTAQGRLTGYILTFLPVVLGFLLYLVNPEHISLLWKRPMGIKMLYTSFVMILIGGLIIRKIVRIRV